MAKKAAKKSPRKSAAKAAKARPKSVDIGALLPLVFGVRIRNTKLEHSKACDKTANPPQSKGMIHVVLDAEYEE